MSPSATSSSVTVKGRADSARTRHPTSLPGPIPERAESTVKVGKKRSSDESMQSGTPSEAKKTGKKCRGVLKEKELNKPSAKARGKRKAIEPPSAQDSHDDADDDDDESRPTICVFECTVPSSLVAKSWRPLAATAREELLKLARDVGVEMLGSLPSTSSSPRSKQDLDQLVTRFSSELSTLLTSLPCPPLPASLRPRSKRTVEEVELISEAVVEKRTAAAARSVQLELAQVEALETALETERRLLEDDEARWDEVEQAAVSAAEGEREREKHPARVALLSSRGGAPTRGLQALGPNTGDEEEEDEDEFGSWTPVATARIAHGAEGGKKGRQRGGGVGRRG